MPLSDFNLSKRVVAVILTTCMTTRKYFSSKLLIYNNVRFRLGAPLALTQNNQTSLAAPANTSLGAALTHHT